MTKIQQLQHALEGTVRACSQLKEVRQEQFNKSVSLPSNAEIVKKMHQMETAVYSHHAEVAKWMLELIEVLG